jgi:hypothetical protein
MRNKMSRQAQAVSINLLSSVTRFALGSKYKVIENQSKPLLLQPATHRYDVNLVMTKTE